ncbi:J domain-containing protein [Halobiforma nitratireducens]|uniref:Heat shock protein DnaJ domain-containing protein n=1 Tax=Halobiforma nitratireducens JCM 10879 TaxID=1227454 RepID=M0LCT5_9EURY|nr:DnaJ domain-containing protein [Halobiforma nitratireducens]EMA30923.1 heat shock protein DnaJ domain-containing protein [Halobiforma nitratireducens JCM 10879]
MVETYYEVLEVDPDATQADIEAAYRERVLETHPDQSDDADAATEFQRVTEAESVLSDESERARYDRLGHDAYVRLEGGPTLEDTGTTADSTDRTETSAADSTDRTRTDSADGGTGGSRRSTTTAGSAGSGTSTRHRWERVKEEVRQERSDSSAGFSAGAHTGTSTGVSGTTETVTGFGSATETASGENSRSDEPEAGEDTDDGYTVHDWNGEIHFEWEGRPFTQAAAVTLACIWVLYPLLVYSTVTPAFPLGINGIVAACTLALVAYTLTFPRVATAVFGTWGVVLPAVAHWTPLLSPTSLRGMIAIGLVWVPLGYAVAVWWALRP